MANRRVTFEVDTGVLFDMLQSLGGDTGHLGQRVVSSLLADPGNGELLGMAAYGVVLVESAPVPGLGNPALCLDP
jgi:hypothetical protein